ncbi:MAG: stage V sporulation protein AA [Pseudobutyrivibrio sp.]|nr:stage V sporulation protein AA [Pseudobutyrivibrio sp.]
MSSKVLYLKAEQNAEVMQAQVCVKDIASVYCSDRSITSKVKALKIYQFQEEKRKRQVISVLRVIELIEKECPAVTVESVGENATLIELVNVSRHKTMAQTVRLIFVMLISFFGTGFTIMAFHNDISITDVFERFYLQVMGRKKPTVSVIEISYSIGLAVGILFFYNHFGNKKFTHDPTPMQVEMRKYEQDVDTTIIENSARRGENLDVS